VTESCIRKGQAFVPFAGYNCIRADGDCKSRGVAILHKSHIKATSFDLSVENLSSNIELLCVKFQLDFNKSILVVVIYRHPDYSKLTLKRDNESFDVILSSLCLTGFSFFVVGDFNLRQCYYNALHKIVLKHHLVQLVDKPTRLDNILDLIICPSSAIILKHSVFDAGLADHMTTDIIVALTKPKPAKTVVAFRQFSRIDHELLLFYLSNMLIEPSLCPVSHTSYLQGTILSVFDALAPLKKKSFYPKQIKKFVSQTTKTLLSECESAYLTYQKNPSIPNHILHSDLKKLVKNGILKDTRTELDERIKSKGTWSGIKSIYALKQTNSDRVNLDPNEINDFFVSISLRSSNDEFNDSLPSKPNELVIPDGISFTFPILSVSDVT
jgi:hypothetical protein